MYEAPLTILVRYLSQQQGAIKEFYKGPLRGITLAHSTSRPRQQATLTGHF